MLWESRPQTTVTTYPVEHENLIRKYAKENGIEPAYVAAVIMAESSYRTDAVSSVNAQGLMQLLPSTGEWVAKKLNESYASGSLFDPETNLRYGCWYLGWLMERYDGSMKCASSAYHQGQGTVDKWLKKARQTNDPNERAACYKQFQIAMAEAPAYTFFAYIDAMFIADSNIKGIDANTVLGHHGVGIFWNITEWSMA